MTRHPASRFHLLLTAGAFALSGPALAAGKPLFLGEVAPAARDAQAVAALSSQPTTFELRVVRADARVVSADTREIELDLGPHRVTAVLDDAHATATGSLVWTGHVRETAKARLRGAREVRSDELNSAILVRRGDGITGNVRVDGRLFRIRPLPDGNHAVIEVDESQMPPDHPEAYSDLPQVQMALPSDRAHLARGIAPAAIDPGPTATIRVMVVATNQAVSAYGGDMQALVELAVAESNQGYVNSNVGINLELAGYYTTSYAGIGFSTDLARFRGTSDGYMNNFHATRDQIAADVGMLVINDSAYCGLASGIGSSASTAFAAVYWDCATGYYSFAHEIGHLQSARHDPATDPNTTPYPYGHGYRAPNNAWRTIMAYNCSQSCPRLNYWSNPDVTYGGVPMGTASQSHNQRVLVNTKATIADFRDGGGGGGGDFFENTNDYTINDNSTVESPITVSGVPGNAPSDLAIAVTIYHTYRGDLRVDLVAPDGSVYNLHNRGGGSADNLIQTYTRNVSSEVANGTWKLRVNDNANQDTGRIDKWSLQF